MKGKTEFASFSIPYEIAAVRPLRRTTRSEREETLKKAHYNTELIPQDMIYVDLKTDSGVSSLGISQISAMLGAERLESGIELAPEANISFTALSKQFQAIYGFPFVVPCSLGRAAERIWIKIHVREGAVVAGNMLFPSTRFHIESSGAKIADVTTENAYDLFSDDPFKGNIDLGKLEKVIEEHGREKIACVYVELCVNSCGGHPVSMANLKQLKSFLQPKGIPLFLDASRIVENSRLIQEREEEYQKSTIAEIAREICSYADGCTLSALKDFSVREGGFIGIRDGKSFQRAYFQSFFDGAHPSSPALDSLTAGLREIFRSDQYAVGRVEEVRYLWQKLVENEVPVLRPAGGHAVFIDVKSFLPHLSAEGYPTEALAAFIYSTSGIRTTKGPPLARSQSARGIELMRLAVPARRYLRGHLDDIAAAVIHAFAHKDEIRGLKRIEKPERSKYDPPLFVPIGA